MLSLVLLAAAVACLPPDMPPLDTLQSRQTAVYMVEGAEAGETYPLLSRVYTDGRGRFWRVFLLHGSVALVDDHMTDDAATDWWVDRGLLTDDIPPRVASDPKPTCQFHRRGIAS